jgi:hypothetical protein
MKVKLTHSSSHPDGAGNVGDVIDVPDELAERWLQPNGGAVLPDDDEPAPPPSVDPPDGMTKAKTKGKKS